MNRKFPFDRFLLLLVLCLLGIGLVMVFSASSVVSRELYGSPTHIFFRQLVAAGLGLFLMSIAMQVDYRHLGYRGVVYSLLLLCVLLLLMTQLSGSSNGARRWISLGPLNFQPSELAKLAVLLFTASFLTAPSGERVDWGRRLGTFLVVLVPLLGLILLGRDLGTAFCIGATAVLLLYLGGLPGRYLLGLALTSLPLLGYLIWQTPYRLKRILSFLDPNQDPFGVGYQTRQSLIAVGSGGWTGLGLAEGKQKLFYLPEAHTDFIYAVIGEELGLLGTGIVLLLFALLFWRGVRVALRASTPLGTFLGMGIVSLIVTQALLNMSVVLNLVPPKGLPLPFISVGGSSLMINLTMTGILLNISRESRGRLPEQSWWKLDP